MTPRPAATVMLLRGSGGRLEVLMVRRTPTARFMAGYWVFPGGALDPADGEGQPGLRSAAARELEEEAGVALPRDGELVPFARWITPERSPIRFDTWFYLALAPKDARPRIDGVEIVDWRWLTPAQALTEAEAGTLLAAFPTKRELERLGELERPAELQRPAEPQLLEAHGSAAQLLERARALAGQIETMRPIMLGDGDDAEIVLP